jgi:polyphosphate kinase
MRVVSIVGRHLEHHRVYCFHNRGDPLYYIGSADWMSRNLSKRVEVAAPIVDPTLRQQLQEVLALALFDSINAWDMLPNGRYVKPAFQMDDSLAAAPFNPE